jgi:hypothetical protein
MTDTYEEVELLKANPTHDGWQLELQRILDGYREMPLAKLGTAAQYAKVVIQGSRDVSKAQVAFRRTLEESVSPYPWMPRSKPLATLRMLELIREFRPNAGAFRVMAFLREWGGSDLVIENAQEKLVDLHMLALQILEEYFPTPRDESGEYSAYLQWLRVEARSRRYGDYALTRLERLNELDEKEYGEFTDRVVVSFRERVREALQRRPR